MMVHPSTEQSAEENARLLLELLRELVAELRPGPAPVPRIDLESSLDRDLGLDSLARMELLSRMERRFGVRPPERAVGEAERVRDLLAALAAAGQVTITLADERIAAVAVEADWETPHRAGTLGEVLDWHVARHPERPHVRFYADRGEGDILTYRRLRDAAAAIAAGLQALGIAPGERVAIMLPTGADYLAAFLGVVLAGAAPAPIYPPTRLALLEDHLRRQLAILSTCSATALITFAEARPFARLLKLQLPSLKHLLTVADLTADAGQFAPPSTQSGAIAMLQYTSGSTGNPKGVILSHANLLANIRAMGRAAQVTEADVLVSWLPLYHDMGLIGTWLAALYFGLPLVLLSPLDFLARPARWLWAIHRHRGTLSPAPNFAYEICLTRLGDEELAGLDLSSWRCAFNGAEPVAAATLERFAARFAPHGFRREALMPVYGLAENSVGLAFPPRGRGPLVEWIDRATLARHGRAVPTAESAAGVAMVACGRPLAGHEIRVVGPGGQELPERREGRVQFRGPSATSGYFGAPEQTARLFAGDWLETGDLGYLAGGELYLTGRSKDLIILAGRNVYPHELETAVGALDGIRRGNVVVFGRRDAASGTERLVLVAETRVTETKQWETLRQGINALAVELVGAPVDELVLAPPGALLKTSSGKLRRAACRERYLAGRLGLPEPRWRMLARLGLTTLAGTWRGLRQRFADQLRGRYLRALFRIAAPPVWLAVAVLPRPASRWLAMRKALRWLSRWGDIPLTVLGAEHYPSRPCVVVANHASYLDGLVLVAALPGEFSFVAKAELQRGRLSEPFLRRIGGVFVERFDTLAAIGDARRIGQLAKAGRTLVYFPEGTFHRAPGLRPFHLGAFLAAAEAGLPVTPVAIRGTRSILRGEDKLPHRGAIEVEIGPPLEPAGAASSWDEALRLRELARRYLVARCGEPDLGEEES